MLDALISPKKKRIVVKIGSHVLSESGKFTHAAVQRLADQLIEVARAGNEVLLISSGAILVGRNLMGLDLDLYPQNLRQSLAAVGQVSLKAAVELAGYNIGQGKDISSADVLA